jgi:hypothetical protein
MVWIELTWLRIGNEPSGPYNARKFLNNCTIGGFSRSAQLHE